MAVVAVEGAAIRGDGNFSCRSCRRKRKNLTFAIGKEILLRIVK